MAVRSRFGTAPRGAAAGAGPLFLAAVPGRVSARPALSEKALDAPLHGVVFAFLVRPPRRGAARCRFMRGSSHLADHIKGVIRADIMALENLPGPAVPRHAGSRIGPDRGVIRAKTTRCCRMFCPDDHQLAPTSGP